MKYKGYAIAVAELTLKLLDVKHGDKIGKRLIVNGGSKLVCHVFEDAGCETPLDEPGFDTFSEAKAYIDTLAPVARRLKRAAR